MKHLQLDLQAFCNSQKVEIPDYLFVEYSPEVLNYCAKRLSISIIDLTSRSQKRDIVDKRAITYNFLRDHTKLTLKKMGSIFGRDHASILNGLNLYKDLYGINKEFTELADRL